MGIKISASLINDWLACKARAYYRINYPEENIPTEESTIGTIAHKAIERFWDNPDSGYDFVSQEVSNHNLDRDAREHLAKCMYNFYWMFSEHLGKDDIVEKYFSVEIQDGVRIVGKMDRITVTGLIFDWKTTRRPPSDISRDPQFILYDWAYQKIYGRKSPGVFFASLSEAKLVRKTDDVFATKELFDIVIPSLIGDIKNGDFPRTGLFSRACYRCQFKKICLGGDDELGSSKPSQE